MKPQSSENVLHARWLSETLEGPLPEETQSTCSACPMCLPAAEIGRSPVRAFSPNTKCCTFWPTLPNYLVGAILSDTTTGGAEGRRRVAPGAMSADVTPLGIGPSQAYQAMYSALSVSSFGVSEDLRCPYYEAGQCTVWKYRNGVCATWFCKPDRGSGGERVWREVHSLLGHIERTVALWCARSLGIPPAGLAAFPRQADGAGSLRQPSKGEEHRLSALWGRHSVDINNYYVQCSELAADLHGNDLVRLGGIECEVRLEAVRQALRRLDTSDMPRLLVPGPLRVLARDSDQVIVASYKTTDPQRVNSALFARLGDSFNLSPEAFTAHLQKTAAVSLSEPDLRRLLDLEILTESPDMSSGRP